MKKHDENKDVKLVSRIAKVDTVGKTIKAAKSSNIGIRTWGRIDFLTHYCGYVFIWDNGAGTGMAGTNMNYQPYLTKNKKDKTVPKVKRNNKRAQ